MNEVVKFKETTELSKTFICFNLSANSNESRMYMLLNAEGLVQACLPNGMQLFGEGELIIDRMGLRVNSCLHTVDRPYI